MRNAFLRSKLSTLLLLGSLFVAASPAMYAQAPAEPSVTIQSNYQSGHITFTITFYDSTPGAEFHYTITNSDGGPGGGGIVSSGQSVQLVDASQQASYNTLTAYATDAGGTSGTLTQQF